MEERLLAFRAHEAAERRGADAGGAAEALSVLAGSGAGGGRGLTHTQAKLAYTLGISAGDAHGGAPDATPAAAATAACSPDGQHRLPLSSA